MLYTLGNSRTKYKVAREVRLVDFANPFLADAFGRLRFSQPETLFDSKSTSSEFDAIFFDNAQASGGGTGIVYSQPRASYTMSVSAATAGKRIRQTKQRFNYQPGKGQLILMSVVLGAKAAGITKRIGYFDEKNGVGLKIGPAGMAFFIRSSVTGTPVDIEIPESDWSIQETFTQKDITAIDPAKSQILFMDFEWLGVGSVRFGFVKDGKFVGCWQQNNAGVLPSVYMSTPNLPLRYEIENDGTGGADSLEAICASVVSEGGQEDTGVTKYISNGSTAVAANATGTLFALVGIQLKAANLGSVVKIVNSYVMTTSNPNFEWVLLLNPTVAGTFTYSDVTNSAIQRALGATANTVTGGTALSGGYSTNSAAAANPERTLYYLGSTIAGVSDQIVLCARTLGANANFFGALNIRELK